jgi:DNA polymerase epsilon subunit 1
MAIRKRNNPRVFTRSNNNSYNPRLKTLGAEETTYESSSRDERMEATRFSNEIDRKMGFERYEGGKKQRVGWLVNMHTTMLIDEDQGGRKSAVDFYFLDEDGRGFKATMEYNPYFLIACKVVSLITELMIEWDGGRG